MNKPAAAFCRLKQKPANLPGLFAVFKAALGREWRMQVRRRGDLVNPLVFFALVVVLFPLGISPTEDILAPVAPGVLWVAALLATLMSLDALFRPDLLDGSLEQQLVTGYPLAPLALAKLGVHWLLSSLPLILLSPFLGIMLYLPWEAQGVMMLALLLGSLALSLVGAIGAALTAGVGKSGVLMTLLVLPFYIPVLIFGTGAMQAAISGGSAMAHLSLLGALAALAITLAPWAIAAGLKIAVSGE
ncbi:heme exporter protein B [Marinospirillum celere]|uniref:Heme exporter protein B n=1 Tax=Marinospirillum celere TaxID=1122252 RepID=A0A1I1GZP4_9GAMM|nr:heme exporter protein CcmB [Marinospirillum celere]SFC16976.1 heme exporter protein B [Marinospirillum celere]